jgi:hypothetical protein
LLTNDRGVMEAHLALLGWVPFDWDKGGAHNPAMSDIVVWVTQFPDNDDDIGWTKRSMFPTALDPEPAEWVADDAVFWRLAKALTEDERFT